MSAPGSAPLGPPGPPARRRGGTATPALPSAPRRVYCLRCVKWLGTAPDHVCLQKANRTRCDPCTKNGSACLKIPPRFRTVVAKIQADAAALPGLPAARRTPAKNALVIAAATLGSRVDKHNWRMKKESGDRKSLSLVERNTMRFQESLLARLDSLESAYRTAHGQPPAALDDDDSDDEEDGGCDDDGDEDGDGDGDSVAAGAVAGGS
ncbi:MAG: hypothetical protein M1816_003880 [Peltula sp. TS41687]|nr:MAG: hypothetical protein M1816_003880 [Peltula sp. TS41687]